MRAMVQCAAVRNHLTVKTLQHNARMDSLLSARLKVVVIRAARRCYGLLVPVDLVPMQVLETTVVRAQHTIKNVSGPLWTPNLSIISETWKPRPA